MSNQHYLRQRLAALSPAKRALFQREIERKNTKAQGGTTIQPREKHDHAPLSFAQGLGLSLPLSSFIVSVRPNETSLLLADRFDIGEQARWILMDVSMGEGFAAALAAERRTGISP
jgi:hypothetical protein